MKLAQAVNYPPIRNSRHLNPEKYLQVINNYFIPKQLTRFRISNHQLLIEEGTHRGIDPIDRRCKFCDTNCVENEIHFLLVCPLYHNLRLKYILILEHLGFYQPYSNFIKIMSSENKKVIRNLALFVYKAFQLRTKSNK